MCMYAYICTSFCKATENQTYLGTEGKKNSTLCNFFNEMKQLGVMV